MTVSDEIIKVLNAFSKKIGITIDWTQNNILPYMQKLCDKYITYEMITSIFWIIIGICLLILGIYCIKKSKYYWMKKKEEKKGKRGILKRHMMLMLHALFLLVQQLLVFFLVS